MDTLGTIILILLVIYGLIRLLGPFLLRLLVKRMSKRAFNNINNFWQNQQREQRREGEITIEKDINQEKIIDKNVGEYVDFEESSSKEGL